MAQVIQLRDYGRRVRAGVHAQQIHVSSRVRLDFAAVESVGVRSYVSSIAAAGCSSRGTVRRSLGRLCSRTCSTRVEASIVKALSQAAPLRGLLNFSGREDVS